MKIYSYISALLIAGIASFSSCSQEEDVKEMNGDNSSSGLQISVSDGGYFDTTPGTRAIEKPSLPKETRLVFLEWTLME